MGRHPFAGCTGRQPLFGLRFSALFVVAIRRPATLIYRFSQSFGLGVVVGVLTSVGSLSNLRTPQRWLYNPRTVVVCLHQPLSVKELPFPPKPTMATTNEEPPFTRHTTPGTTRPSFWVRIQRQAVQWMHECHWDCAPCGRLPDNWEDWEEDEAMRLEVAKEMRYVRLERQEGEDDVSCAIREVALDGGFATPPSTGRSDLPVAATGPPDRVIPIDPALTALVVLMGDFELEGCDSPADDDVSSDVEVEEPPGDGKGQEGIRRRVRTHATFVSRMVIVLRARLGRLEPEPANQLLVNKEYSRLLRKEEYGLRAIDIEMHRRDVINVYFSDLDYERVPLVRSTLPSWFRNLMGMSRPTVRPLVC